MKYIIPLSMIFYGIVVGILIGVGKVNQGALLIIGPMIMFGFWILAFTYVERRFTLNGKG